MGEFGLLVSKDKPETGAVLRHSTAGGATAQGSGPVTTCYKPLTHGFLKLSFWLALKGTHCPYT